MGEQPGDVWRPLRYFEGQWVGEGGGQVGESTVEREYRFVLGGQFLEVRNRSVYEPQEANPEGEIHEDFGYYSYDKGRETFVLRQFHVEGFVNQYALDRDASDDATLVFLSEAIENVPEGFRARETYTIVDDKEFRETFDLASPGKAFACYIDNRLRRKE